MQQSSPILVIGMHRSGTRLLAELLARLGVFMGADRQGDAESITFLRINEALFHQCATFWSEPLPVHVTLAQPDQCARLAGLARETLLAELGNYTGQSGTGSGVALDADGPFGWKDPRNTFTLPVWRRVFPRCRVIHLVRHGVDVAMSLAKRQRELYRSATSESVPSPLAVFEDHALGVLSSRRGWTLAEALTMWEQYVEKARLEAAELAERALEVRFEDLLARPDELVARVAEFCGLAAPASPAELLGEVRAERGFAYRNDPELVEFADSVGDVLARYGYSA